jgi:hypothetical protein
VVADAAQFVPIDGGIGVAEDGRREAGIYELFNL